MKLYTTDEVIDIIGRNGVFVYHDGIRCEHNDKVLLQMLDLKLIYLQRDQFNQQLFAEWKV